MVHVQGGNVVVVQILDHFEAFASIFNNQVPSGKQT